MNSHFVRKAGLCGLTSVIATLGVAAVASAAPAGGAQQATTSRPDIVSAVITDQPSITNATGTPQIKACFDSQIASPVAASFAATGTDVSAAGNPLAPAAAQSIPTELNCVSLTFPAGTNLAAFSAVQVQAGAVQPPGGGAGANPQGAAALTGGDVAPGKGRTAGPNLTGVSAPAEVAGGSEVTYSFDKLITQTGELGPAAGRFGYYSTAGVAVGASSIVAVSDRGVKVKFATIVPAAARMFVSNDAVKLASQPAQGNAPTATPVASSAPDLIAIAYVPSLQATFDLSYDAPVTTTNELAGNCQANTPAGRFAGTAGTGAERQHDPRDVRRTGGQQRRRSGDRPDQRQGRLCPGDDAGHGEQRRRGGDPEQGSHRRLHERPRPDRLLDRRRQHGRDVHVRRAAGPRRGGGHGLRPDRRRRRPQQRHGHRPAGDRQPRDGSLRLGGRAGSGRRDARWTAGRSPIASRAASRAR